MIKPHLLYVGSPDRGDFFKLSLDSFEKFGCSDYYSTIIINTLNKGKSRLDLNSDVIYDDSHYKDHPPVRWFVEPKSEVCLFIDHDVVTCSSVRPLVEMCSQTKSVCGVIAFCCKIEKELLRRAFESCGVTYLENRETWVDKTSIPRYYNYGMLAVPSVWLKQIREPLSKNIEVVNKLSEETQDHYLIKHGGQVALAITLEQLDVPTTDLDIGYNFPNIFEVCHPEKIVFRHMLDKSKLSIEKIKGTIYDKPQLKML